MYTINDLPNGNIAMRVTNKDLALEILIRAFPLDSTFMLDGIKIGEIIIKDHRDSNLWAWFIDYGNIEKYTIIDDENIVIEELNNFQLVNK